MSTSTKKATWPALSMRSEFTQPGEIADVFAFLASAESNCINSCTCSVDDGFLNFKYPLLPKACMASTP
jgi:hypothetical protein